MSKFLNAYKIDFDNKKNIQNINDIHSAVFGNLLVIINHSSLGIIYVDAKKIHHPDTYHSYISSYIYGL